MAKDEDIHLDDDDMFGDGELDFTDDPLSFDFEEQQADRKPIETVAEGMKEGAIESATDEYKLRELANKALPKQYVTAANDVSEIKRAIEVPAQQMATEVRKELIGLKRSTNKLTPMMRRTFGDKIGDKFDKLTKVEDKTKDSEIQISEEDAAVANSLRSTFGAALEQINAKRNEDQVEQSTLDIIRAKEGKKQFSVTADLQSRMATGIEALVNYNNQIDVQYKRTNIEIGQRQLFTLRKILEVATETANGQITELKAITKNTALPDIIKQNLSENFSQISEDKLIGRVHEKAHDVAGGYVNKMIENAAGLAREKVDEIKGVASQIADMVESYASMSDMEAEMSEMEGMPGEDKRTRAIKTVSKMVASMGLSKAGEAAAHRFLKYLEANPTAMKVAGNLDYYSNNKAAAIDDFIGGNQDAGGVKGLLAKGLSKIAPSLQENREELLNNTVEDATQGVSWDLLSRKTLVEIIPAWFSKLEHNQRIGMYGEGQAPLTFDHGSDKFTTMATAASNALNRFLGKDKKDELLNQSNELVDLLDKDGKLTKSQREALQRSFLESADNSLGFSASQLTEGKILTSGTSSEDQEAIIALARERFGLKEGDKGHILKDDEAIKLRNKMASNFRTLSQSAPDIQKNINNYQKVGGKDILRNVGLIQENEHGIEQFSHSNFYDQFFTDNVGDGGKVGGSLRAPIGGIPQTAAANENFWSKPDQEYFISKLLAGLNEQSEAKVAEDRKLEEGEAEDTNPILTRFDATNLKLDEANQQLLLIAALLQEGITINDGESQSGIKGLISGFDFSKMGANAKNFIKNGFSRINNLRKLAMKPIDMLKNGVGRAKEIVKSGFRFGRDAIFGTVSDIYLTGEREPRLLAEDIKAGKFIDAKTGLVIKSIKDITGAVIDADGNFILTEDQFNDIGIEERSGMQRKMRGMLSGATKRARDVMSLPFTVAKKLFSGGAAFLEGAKNRVEDLINKARDVYVAGESEARLKKHIMEAGGYIDKATGKVIRNLKDITGDVIDLDGNVVLTAKEISEGLFDVSGAKIRIKGIASSLGEKAVGAFNKVKDAALLPFKMAGKGLSELRKIFESKALQSLFLNLPDNVMLKAKTVHLYTEALNEVQGKVKGDASGDGLRDGSWQEQMNKDKASADKGKEPKGKKEKKEKKGPGFGGLGILTGFFGSMMEKFSGFGTILGSLSGVITSAIGTVTTALSAGFKAVVTAITARKATSTLDDVGMDTDKDGKKKGRKGKGRGGRFSKAMDGLKRTKSGSTAKAAKAASTGSKGGLLRAAGRGAMTLGSAALGFISAPIAVGALAVISIGVAGYYLWGYFSRRKDMGELERMRFIQYGANDSSENVKVNIRYLEGELIGKVQAMGGGIDIPLTAEEVWREYASDFGFIETDVDSMYSWANWYNTRFKPVFLTWVAAASGFTGKDDEAISFASVDSDLKLEDRVKFIEATIFDGGVDDPYAIEGLVYKSSPTVYFRKDVEAYLAELKAKAPKAGKPLTASKQAVGAKPSDRAAKEVARREAAVGYAGAAVSKDSVPKLPKGSTIGALGEANISSKPKSTVVPLFSANKKASLPILTSVEKVRFLQYGANLHSAQHLNSLIALETLLANHITISDKEVKLDLTISDVLDKVGGAFGIVDGDAVRSADFKAWFNYRFLPIFNRFVRVLAKSNTDLVKYKRKLQAEDEIRLIYSSLAGRLDTAEGHTPFESSFSPWPNYEMPIDPQILARFVQDEVDNIQRNNNISQDVEDKANLSRMREFATRAKEKGEVLAGGVPAVGLFNQTSPKSKQDYQKSIDLTKLGGYKTDAVKLGGTTGGKVAPHDAKDKVEKRIAQYNDIIAAASEKYGVDQHLIRSVIRQESAGNPNAVSPVGAVGLMQFMPATAKDMGIVDRTDPTQSIFGGAKYLRMLLKRYDNNVELALAAYNAGMGNVDKAVKAAGSTNGGMMLAALPTITGRHAKETQGYVSKITADYARRTKQNAGMKGVDFSTTHTTAKEKATTAAMATVPSTSAVGATSGREDVSAMETASKSAAQAIDTSTAQTSPDYTARYRKEMLTHTESMAKTLTRIEKLLLEQSKMRSNESRTEPAATPPPTTSAKAKEPTVDIYASPEDALPVSMRKVG